MRRVNSAHQAGQLRKQESDSPLPRDENEWRREAMKVLVACEESQTVCKAFRARGHEAYSCDIQEPSGGHPEWHILGDALEALRGGDK